MRQDSWKNCLDPMRGDGQLKLQISAPQWAGGLAPCGSCRKVSEIVFDTFCCLLTYVALREMVEK